MTKPLIQVGELATFMQEKPITLVRAVMDDPVTSVPDKRVTCVLPASVDIDLDSEGSDHSTGLPHSMPTSSDFALYLGKQGITANTPVVVYDSWGMYCAPRVWWMLKAVGHRDVHLLDGGLPAWQCANFPLVEQQQFGRLTYQAYDRKGWFVDTNTVLSAIGTNTQIIDARSRPRFNGEIPEPRAGLRSGHIPGAFNIPFNELVQDGCFLPVEKLKAVFHNANIDLSLPIITSCGSGITACIIGVAAIICGATNVSVYDGAWAQWGADETLPVSTQ